MPSPFNIALATTFGRHAGRFGTFGITPCTSSSRLRPANRKKTYWEHRRFFFRFDHGRSIGRRRSSRETSLSQAGNNQQIQASSMPQTPEFVLWLLPPACPETSHDGRPQSLLLKPRRATLLADSACTQFQAHLAGESGWPEIVHSLRHRPCRVGDLSSACTHFLAPVSGSVKWAKKCAQPPTSSMPRGT